MNPQAQTILEKPHESSRDIVARLRLLYRYRELAGMLAWRDIRVRYKHSLLGAAWAVTAPIGMMLIFSFVFSTVMGIDREKLTNHPTLPYALFALTGLVPWIFFANGLGAAIGSLVANRPLVTKIYFPREVFPVAAVGSAFVDFLISCVVLAVITAYFHTAPNNWLYVFHWTALLTPLVVLVQIVFMVGLGLLLSMANLFYRDVGFLFRSIIQLWMFLTCVVYPLEPTEPWKKALIQLNPMTPIIDAYRGCLFRGEAPFNLAFGHASAVAAVMLIIGWWWFRQKEFDFAENI